MASSGGDEEDNYWPGYVDALTTMTMVLTFILMVLGIVVFSLSQSVSRAYIDAIADAAGLPHPKSVEQSSAVIAQVVSILRDKDREANTGGLAARGDGVENTSSKVASTEAQSVARVDAQGNSVPAEQERGGPASVALPDPDPVYFAAPTNGGVPQDVPRPSGERLTSASREQDRPESLNRPLWDPKAEVGHLTMDRGDAPLALAGRDPVRIGQPGKGEVPAVEQTALATETAGKATVAGRDAPADQPTDATAPPQQARVDLRPVPDAVAQTQPGQPGLGDATPKDSPAVTSDAAGSAAVAGRTSPADQPSDVTKAAQATRVALAPAPGASAQNQPGQPGKGDAAPADSPSVTSEAAGNAAVAGRTSPTDQPSDATTAAQASRVALAPAAGATQQNQPGQRGRGTAEATDTPAVTSHAAGGAAVAGETAVNDAEAAPAAPATMARVDVAPMPDLSVAAAPGQKGRGETKAADKPAERKKPAPLAPGNKVGTDKTTKDTGTALASLTPAPDATAAPLSGGPSADEQSAPGGVPFSLRDKPNPDPSQVIESTMDPKFRQTSSGADVTTAGAAITIRFKPRSFTLTDGERGQLRDFVKDLTSKGVANINLEAVAAVTHDGFSDERRAAYSRMMIIRNELLAANVLPQAIQMKVVDSVNGVEANVVKIKRP